MQTSLPSPPFPFAWIASVGLLWVLAAPATPLPGQEDDANAEPVLPLHRIAIVRDRDSPFFDAVIKGFRSELEALAEGQYRYEILDTFNADGDPARVPMVLRQALDAPNVSVIYTAGFVSTFAAASLDADVRQKPIVGGAVEFVDVNGEQISADGGSRIPNYTFIQSPRRIEADLEKLAELSGAEAIYAIVDRFAFQALEGVYRPKIDALAEKLGVRLQAIPRGETAAESVAALPDDATAVYVPILSGVSEAFRRDLYAALSARGIMTLSILGIRDVEIGAFAGLASDDRKALYRRIALNLHQILSGVPTSLLPVLLRADDQLVINMKTAAALGWSPDYETSLAARLLHQDALFSDAEELTLEGAMELGEQLQPQVAAAQARTRAEEYRTRFARAGFLPKLDVNGTLGASGVTDRITPALTPSHAQAASLGVEVRQLLYSDQVLSQTRAQERVVAAARLDEQSVRLDAVEAAGVAFLDVLAAEALYGIEKQNLQIVENNLQLAKLRGDIGAAEAVEVFRWQASRAQSNANLYQRDANRKNARVALNVALGVERTRYWTLRDIELADDDFYFMNEPLSGLVTDFATFSAFIEFLRSEARGRSPEIQAFEENIEAQGILLRERSRRNFVPVVSGVANFDRVLQGAHSTAADSQNEWSVGIGFVLPLFDGTRTAETGQIRSVRDQLSAQRDQALFLVEQRALAAAYGIGSSHPAMLFSRQALTAARDNFDAVQAKYQQGAATILDLLDAQRELLIQTQNEALAGYQYLRDVIAVQRSIAWFEYSKTEPEKTEWIDRLTTFLENRKT